MSIESLKQQARKHEQNEDWTKALDHYKKALAALARADQVDIGLYNRVGDLHVRVGDLDEAVEHYDKAVGLYREAYLPNNAIAVCKKIIRNAPDRHRAYLLIGQIRAEQGFFPDARTNFLTYAERMAQDGDLDESFRALIEFCELAPDEVELRLTVAEQMASSGRAEEATEQFLMARRHYAESGMASEAQRVEARILQLDPGAFEIGAPTGGKEADDGGFDLPMLSWDDDDADVATELPMMETAGQEDADGGFDLPLVSMVEESDEALDDDLGMTLTADASIESEVSDAFESAMEEVASDAGSPMPEPPSSPVEPGPPVAEAPAPEPPAAKAPTAGFVDFGAMILGSVKEKDTRMRVSYEEPSGDEQADFARMLSQFKDKVSENLDASDVRAHHDLGTAFKEMGLLDEAISSFQAALRASPHHLPTFELMGQTFLEMNQPEAAVRSLERALTNSPVVEDELVGIYYYLGRAYESLQNRESATEYYDRVFSLDINFADVTERLRALR